MKYLLISLSVLSSSSMAAGLNLTLEQTIELSKSRSEQVQISNYQLEEAKISLKKAYSSLFPKISLEAKAMKTTQNPTLFGSAGPSILSENYQQIGSINLTQPIYTFGRLSGGVDAAKGQGKLAKNYSIATLAEVKTTAKSLFFNALFYKETLAISQNSYDNALKNQTALKKRVPYGRISQDENLKMKADIASRKPSLLEAKRMYRSAISDLKSFLNLKEDVEITLVGDLNKTKNLESNRSDIKLSELVQVKLLDNQFEIQKALSDISSAAYYPTLSFFASYGKSAYFDDIVEDHYLDQENIGFGLVLSMDFDLGGGKTYDMQVSNIQTRVKSLEVTQGKRKIKFALQNLYDQQGKLKEKREALKEAVDLAASSYKIARNSFSNGTISQAQLNDRELLLTNNKIAFAQSLLQLQFVEVEIEKMETTKN